MLAGRAVVDASAFDSEKFLPALLAVGSRIATVRRRGKYLLLPLRNTASGTDDESELVVHLGMTGRLWVASTHGDSDSATHLRARWDLDDGRTLFFDDVRRFGRIAVVARGDYRSLPTLDALGPEPFDEEFNPEQLRSAINSSNRAVKTQLLSQRVVAGVGNIYADEALWRAGVRPSARRLTRAAAVQLHAAIRDVLEAGVKNGGTTLRDYRDATGGAGTNQFHLECYGRSGEPCRRCGDILRRSVIDARTTAWCATCQR